MGFTYEQAKQLGIGHLHPAVAGGRSKERELLDSVHASEKLASKAPDDGLNKTERAFRDDVLEPAWVRGAIGNYWREPVKLRLAGKTFLTPDFLAIDRTVDQGIAPLMTFCEIKGFMREDANVKIKVAANMYQCFRWLLIYREGRRGWRVHEVTNRGIREASIIVPWIHGEGI